MADSDGKTSTSIDGNTLVAMCLARAGVDKMFGMVGIPVTSLASLAVALGIRFIAFHNEQSAGYTASAYGYLTGRPDILLTVSGPGCIHGLAGLSNAGANAWPMVLISGSCDSKDFGRGDFQELDQIAAVAPFSKYSVKAIDMVKPLPQFSRFLIGPGRAGLEGAIWIFPPMFFTRVLTNPRPRN